MKRFYLATFIGLFLLQDPALAVPVSALDVAPVWSGHSVGFALLTHADQQFVAYYDADRQLSVAQRTIGSAAWKITKLDPHVGWDSHNYVTMALDRDGYLHVSGDMHVVPLIYFRSTKPLAASTLVWVPSMTGKHEERCTYPSFFSSPTGALVFSYRDGHSGEGDTYYNVYDEKTRSWSSLLDGPLFDGLGKMNAYPMGPHLGPDGLYRVTWVWRNHYMVETNHDLSYAQSPNLRDWETIDGKPLKLPLTIATAGTIVDPIPVNGGIVNGTGSVGFDLQKQPVISYYKFDANGNTQLYFARCEHGAWMHYQATDWDYRWDPRNGGSIVYEISVGPLMVHGDRLSVAVKHVKYGSATWEVDPVTLRLKGKLPSGESPLPPEFTQVRSTFPGMEVRWASDLTPAPTAGPRYRLRWEALGYYRDQPRPQPWPAPTMLQVVTLP